MLRRARRSSKPIAVAWLYVLLCGSASSAAPSNTRSKDKNPFAQSGFVTSWDGAKIHYIEAGRSKVPVGNAEEGDPVPPPRRTDEQLHLAPVVLVGWSMEVPEIAAYVEQFGTSALASYAAQNAQANRPASRVFPAGSNRARSASYFSPLFLTLAEISPLFANTSEKHPGT